MLEGGADGEGSGSNIGGLRHDKYSGKRQGAGGSGKCSREIERIKKKHGY